MRYPGYRIHLEVMIVYVVASFLYVVMSPQPEWGILGISG